jgi:hypothetical protein
MYPYHSSQPDILAAYTAWGDFVYSNKSDDTANIDITAAEYFAKHPEINIKSQHIFDVVFCQTEAANLDSLGAQEHSDFQNGWECGPGNFRFVLSPFHFCSKKRTLFNPQSRNKKCQHVLRNRVYPAQRAEERQSV